MCSARAFFVVPSSSDFFDRSDRSANLGQSCPPIESFCESFFVKLKSQIFSRYFCDIFARHLALSPPPRGCTPSIDDRMACHVSRHESCKWCCFAMTSPLRINHHVLCETCSGDVKRMQQWLVKNGVQTRHVAPEFNMDKQEELACHIFEAWTHWPLSVRTLTMIKGQPSTKAEGQLYDGYVTSLLFSLKLQLDGKMELPDSTRLKELKDQAHVKHGHIFSLELWKRIIGVRKIKDLVRPFDEAFRRAGTTFEAISVLSLPIMPNGDDCLRKGIYHGVCWSSRLFNSLLGGDMVKIISQNFESAIKASKFWIQDFTPQRKQDFTPQRNNPKKRKKSSTTCTRSRSRKVKPSARGGEAYTKINNISSEDSARGGEAYTKINNISLEDSARGCHNLESAFGLGCLDDDNKVEINNALNEENVDVNLDEDLLVSGFLDEDFLNTTPFSSPSPVATNNTVAMNNTVAEIEFDLRDGIIYLGGVPLDEGLLPYLDNTWHLDQVVDALFIDKTHAFTCKDCQQLCERLFYDEKSGDFKDDAFIEWIKTTNTARFGPSCTESTDEICNYVGTHLIKEVVREQAPGLQLLRQLG